MKMETLQRSMGRVVNEEAEEDFSLLLSRFDVLFCEETTVAFTHLNYRTEDKVVFPTNDINRTERGRREK